MSDDGVSKAPKRIPAWNSANGARGRPCCSRCVEPCARARSPTRGRLPAGQRKVQYARNDEVLPSCRCANRGASTPKREPPEKRTRDTGATDACVCRQCAALYSMKCKRVQRGPRTALFIFFRGETDAALVTSFEARCRKKVVYAAVGWKKV